MKRAGEICEELRFQGTSRVLKKGLKARTRRPKRGWHPRSEQRNRSHSAVSSAETRLSGAALRSASVSDSAVPPPAEETFSMLRFEAQRSAHRVGIPMRRRVMARAAGTAGIPFAFWNRLTGRRRHPRANDPSLDFGVAGADWGMSTLSRWIVERTDHAAVVRRRRANFAELIGRIGSTGLVRPLFTALPDGACPWLCPVVVDDADGLIDYLRRRGIEAAPLWRETHAQWPAERFPSAGWLKQRAVALPIHQDLTVEHMQWMAKEIEQWQPSA